MNPVEPQKSTPRVPEQIPEHKDPVNKAPPQMPIDLPLPAGEAPSNKQLLGYILGSEDPIPLDVPETLVNTIYGLSVFRAIATSKIS